MRGLFVVGFLAMACGGATSVAAPAAARAAAAPTTLVVASPPSPGAAGAHEAWLTALDRDNALVGKIWDVKASVFVEQSELLRRLASARFVLLGERHDNADHHRLQGRAVAGLVAAARKPAVVFEMLEVAQQPDVDKYLAQSGASAAGFGTALGWEKTSWPPFSEYQPVFEAAFAGKLRIVAGNLAQADAKSLVKQGVGALSPARVKELRLAQTFPAPLEATLRDELRASHCGQLPEELLTPMGLAQHARDAQMAEVLASAGATDGAVLISGGGHARLDRGVPYYLALDVPGASVMAVSFREVRHGDADPKAYASEEGPFDYVWFTPRGSDEDPCAAFHK